MTLPRITPFKDCPAGPVPAGLFFGGNLIKPAH